MERIGKCLTFLQAEGVKLVGLSAKGTLERVTRLPLMCVSADVYDSSSKVILALLWAIIQHYQLQVKGKYSSRVALA